LAPAAQYYRTASCVSNRARVLKGISRPSHQRVTTELFRARKLMRIAQVNVLARLAPNVDRSRR